MGIVKIERTTSPPLAEDAEPPVVPRIVHTLQSVHIILCPQHTITKCPQNAVCPQIKLIDNIAEI